MTTPSDQEARERLMTIALTDLPSRAKNVRFNDALDAYRDAILASREVEADAVCALGCGQRASHLVHTGWADWAGSPCDNSCGLTFEHTHHAFASAPPVGTAVICLLCTREKPWGTFDARTGAAVCVECRDAAERARHTEPVEADARLAPVRELIEEAIGHADRVRMLAQPGDGPADSGRIYDVATEAIDALDDALRAMQSAPIAAPAAPPFHMGSGTASYNGPMPTTWNAAPAEEGGRA